MKLNKRREERVYNQTDLMELKRAVLATMLWEDQFYESGESIADRINHLTEKVDANTVANLALDARKKQHLRHAPLWLLNSLVKQGRVRGNMIANVISRPDEIPELLSMYWKDGKQPIPKQLKWGLAHAFNKFDQYQLSKYQGKKNNISLRDAMFLVRPKPLDINQARVFNGLANQTLAAPDTWEVGLSAGEDKYRTFSRLLAEGKLGLMAILRNMRNMSQAGVKKVQIKPELIRLSKNGKALPFRYVAAAKHAPASWEDMIEEAMLASARNLPKLPGTTNLIVDVSGSMVFSNISSKSELTRKDAAAALAALAREVCEDVNIVAFDYRFVDIRSRRGFALIDKILNAGGGGTDISGAVAYANRYKADRTILITDEQHNIGSARMRTHGYKNYVINVAAYKNGIEYGNWVRINGWSESVIDWIREYERL